MKMTYINKKIRNLLDNPAYVKNYILGCFKYFPVKPIHNSEMKDIPIYCISLRNACDRRRFMERQVTKAGFRNFIFFDAIDANNLDVDKLISNGVYNDDLAKKYHNRSLNKGEIACSLSHGGVYELILKNNNSMSLILEDDTLFVSDLINAIDVSIFPEDWDIVFLSSFYTKSPPLGHVEGNLYSTESWEGSCAGYIVSKKGAIKLANAYLPVIHAADGFVGRSMECIDGDSHSFKQKGASVKINSYLIYPDPIINGSSSGFWNTSLPVLFK
jgi:glycosyl transferase, family 25